MAEPAAAIPATREARRERTRERLLLATIAVIRREGVGAVSVSRVTREVGVHHSLFYSHFKSVDECLAAAARQVLDDLRLVDAELRSRFFREDVADHNALVALFEDMLGRWLEHRPLVELLLAHRLDRSSFGDVLRPALAYVREALAADLWLLATRLGLHDKHREEIGALADMQLSNWLWALESLIEGRLSDSRAAAELLADGMYGGIMQTMRRRLERSRSEMILDHFSPEERRRLWERRSAWVEKLASQGDEAIMQEFGGPEPCVDALMNMIREHFIPEAAGPGDVVTAYRIETPSTTVVRWMRVSGGQCQVLTRDPGQQSRFTMCASLRTFMEVTSAVRSYSESFVSGDTVLEGDATFSAEFLTWFYQPTGP